MDPNNKTARYGDYLSAHLKSLRKFGYGIFVTRMQAADGPTCSTFWLYSDGPAPGSMPEIAQLSRWNEFDFEFVPYTLSTQNSYFLLDGTFPKPAVTPYRAEMDWGKMNSGQITADKVKWAPGSLITDDYAFSEMQTFYNQWMVNKNLPATQIASADCSFAGVQRTTGPDHAIGGTHVTGTGQPGWPQAEVWKYPLTAVKPLPDELLPKMHTMATLNWWRSPAGHQSLDVALEGQANQTLEYIVKKPALAGSTAAQSATLAAMNNESYVLAGSAPFDPLTSLNTYTVVWTKSRVAFYINAAQDGFDVSASTPVAAYDLAHFPSLAMSGTQAPQGRIPWVDTSFTDALGEVSLNLANYVAFKAAADKDNAALAPDEQAGADWSGLPPSATWPGADAYIRSVDYRPLVSEDRDGSATTDFQKDSPLAWSFNLGDGTWTAANFSTRLAQYFGMIYGQGFTKAGIGLANQRDWKSPLAVTFQANADGTLAADKLPLMKLAVAASDPAPKRNFYVLLVAMDNRQSISATNPFLFATLETAGNKLGVSGASTPLAFFAPAAGTTATATLKLYMSGKYKGSFPAEKVPTIADATATLTLKTDAAGQISWSVDADPAGIVAAYQGTNPHLITVQKGSATPGS